VTDLPTIDPDLDDFYEAWHWLRSHPYFRKGEGRNAYPDFAELVDVIVVKINPETNRIDDDPALNTQVEFWLEACTWCSGGGVRCHDWEMDCGGPTYETAILTLARNVMDKIGDYPAWSICSHCLIEFPAGPTPDDECWFCSPECEACGEFGIRTRPVPGRADVVQMIPAHEVFDGCAHWPHPEPEED
jgi:hypothetical protein